MKPSIALINATRRPGSGAAWTPLILLTRPPDGDEPDRRPGPDLVRAFFGHLRPGGPGNPPAAAGRP